MQFSPLLILPALACLSWAVTHAFLASRTRTFPVLFLLFLCLFFTIAGDVLVGPMLDSEAVAHLFIMLCAPAIIPLTCLYYFHLYRPFTYRPQYLLWITLPFILLTGTFILTLVIGIDGTDELVHRIHSGGFNPRAVQVTPLERLYYYWTVAFFHYVLMAEALYMLIYSILLIRRAHIKAGDLWHFLFNGKPVRLLDVQMWLANIIALIISTKLILHSSFLHENRVFVYTIASVQTLFFFMFGLFALFGTKEFISLTDLRTLVRYNYTPDTRSAVSEEIITDMSANLNVESLTRVVSRLSTQSGSAPGRRGAARAELSPLSASVMKAFSQVHDESSLPARFQHVILSERLFLRPDLTLGDVAERLKVNKTYVSKMVNQTYKTGFPELMNILRVDYAQRYIRNNPGASQEEIAKASGFLSASSFNGTFKRITGFTPKVWAARKDSSGR